MGWRDDLLPGSFRGVQFEVEGTERNGGRRKTVLEAPGRDKPFVQDLGKKARRFRLEAFVLGEDYRRRRDALLNALDTSGTGELVHPLWGSVEVTPLEVSISESNKEGGVARFAISFILEPTEFAISAAVNGLAAANIATTDLDAASVAAITSAITAGSSNVELDAARSEVDAISTDLEAAIGRTSRLGDLAGRAQAAAELAQRARALSDLGLRTGGDWAIWLQGYQGAAGSFGSSFTSRLAAYRALIALGIEMLGVSGAGSQETVRVAAAASAASAATREAAEVSSGWDSRQEALAVRQEILDVADALLDRAPDVLLPALQDLKVAAVAAVPDPSVTLPEVGTYTPPETQPALVAASRLYGDPTRADDIARRNGVRHPGFLRAAQPLEVLIGV